jgi:nucleotide-binding universal stress UspA family protein
MTKSVVPRSKKLPCIVVGVDDAGRSDHAMRAACDLGARLSAEVEFVHAVPVPPLIWPGTDPMRSEALTEELLSRASTALSQRLHRLVPAYVSGRAASSAGGASASLAVASQEEDLVRILPGPPAKVILDRARVRRAQMIVLGGHHKLGALDFGNTVRAVLAKALAPVWVQSHAFHPIEKILVPVDLSQESLASLAKACGLARVLGAKVRVVTCFHVGAWLAASSLDSTGYAAAPDISGIRKAEAAGFEQTMKGFDWHGIEHSAEFVDGEPIETILDLSRSADLIAMGTHGRTGLSAALLGSVAGSVLARSEKPVLAIRYVGRKFLT